MKLHIITTILLWLTLISFSESTQPPFSCDSSDPKTKSLKFCQTRLPISVRVQDLVSRLTLDEKISQLVNSAPAVPRLGIPAYEWWSESLHGVGSAGKGIFFNGSIVGATSFPQVILTAAAFDENLWYRIGQVRISSLKFVIITVYVYPSLKNDLYILLLFNYDVYVIIYYFLTRL